MIVEKIETDNNVIPNEFERIKKALLYLPNEIQLLTATILKQCEFMYNTLNKMQSKIMSNGMRLIIDDKPNPEFKVYSDLQKNYVDAIKTLIDIIEK